MEAEGGMLAQLSFGRFSVPLRYQSLINVTSFMETWVLGVDKGAFSPP
jgi:hypothetical protein